MQSLIVSFALMMLLQGAYGFTLPSYSSTIAQSSTSSEANTQANTIASIFNAPLDQLQRLTLKKKLIQAAEGKNEDEIIEIVNELSKYNPTKVPTLGLMGYGVSDGNGSQAPLNGAWKLLYTNARDAEAPARTEKNKDEQFGDEVATGVIVKTGQRINAAKGECINFIKLTEDVAEGEKRKRPFDEFEITIQMTPMSDRRVRLDFIKGTALNENAPLPFLKEFTFRFPPASFGDVLARLRGLDPAVEPQAYFDILYIDDEIRAHQTGEGKIFVQKRDK